MFPVFFPEVPWWYPQMFHFLHFKTGQEIYWYTTYLRSSIIVPSLVPFFFSMFPKKHPYDGSFNPAQFVLDFGHQHRKRRWSWRLFPFRKNGAKTWLHKVPTSLAAGRCKTNMSAIHPPDAMDIQQLQLVPWSLLTFGGRKVTWWFALVCLKMKPKQSMGRTVYFPTCTISKSTIHVGM